MEAGNGHIPRLIPTLRSTLLKDRRSDPAVEPLPQFAGSFPVDVILVVCVEVQLANLAFAATPNHGPAKAHGKSCFVVDASTLTCEIGHHELTVPDFQIGRASCRERG